jgi:hypothetical protein
MSGKTLLTSYLEFKDNLVPESEKPAFVFDFSQDGCGVSLEVEDFDKDISELQAAGVPFKFSPLETPVCHMAWVRDPDGNLVGIHKRKPGHH